MTESVRKPLSTISSYNFSDRYEADTEGNVYTLVDTPANKKVAGDKIKPFINRYGYVEYNLGTTTGERKHIQAHRIVALLFIDNPENKKYVNHKDGNKNNNSVSNLEWVTASENEKHSHTVLGKIPHNKGKSLPSGREYRGKIRTVGQYTINNELVKIHFNPTEAEKDGFNLKGISAVCVGRQKTYKGFKWKYIEN